MANKYVKSAYREVGLSGNLTKPVKRKDPPRCEYTRPKGDGHQFQKKYFTNKTKLMLCRLCKQPRFVAEGWKCPGASELVKRLADKST